MKKHKILYGVCGIGNGHTQRQLPLIEYFSESSQIVIFGYDASFEFYSKHFKDNPDITVIEVAVPFYVGSRKGIDFDATEKLERNKKDFDGINARAMAQTEEIIGTPNFVISDYEPVSAQYAYSHTVPLVTIDQQSKYLAGEFPTELHGETYADEVARLKIFFPTAAARIACSFFNVTKKENGEEVVMVPPIMKSSILEMENTPASPTSLLVYFSSQKEFPQSLEEVMHVCLSIPEVQFHIFTYGSPSGSSENISVYSHGDERFNTILKNCSGIVSTAGHTLLSEAMHLGIPVYAVPLSVYEQQMNAEVIDKNDFGIRAEAIDKEKLKYFIANLSRFRKAIRQDTQVLLKGDGKEKIIQFLERSYLSS